MTEYVLDACALLALLCDEPGADVVANIINDANSGEFSIWTYKNRSSDFCD
ncbi:MAG: hypothetical protein LBL96_08785 [Clostridiales bacterium]|jgi:PIN domain nuclease of toxin-antitoxin system|nr:hypothetical protein [Clostridiales bacterium]